MVFVYFTNLPEEFKGIGTAAIDSLRNTLGWRSMFLAIFRLFAGIQGMEHFRIYLDDRGHILCHQLLHFEGNYYEF